MNASTGIITTVAGGGYRSPGTGGPATAADIGNVTGIALDAAGNLYLTELEGHCVSEVNCSTGILTVVAGGGSGPVGNGSPATAVTLTDPTNLAVDAAGDLFISDGCVYEVNHATGVIETVAGNGHAGYSGDGGPATAAGLDTPVGVAVDDAGDLFIADNMNQRIREVSLSSGVITTVAGGGASGLGDGGPASGAEFSYPWASLWTLRETC